MAGRDKAAIKWDELDEYLRAGCDGKSIAGIFGIHYNTLYNNVKEKYGCNFGEYAEQKRGEGVQLMEHAIFKDALNKGGIDRIFWLKNKAGWKDKVEQTVKIPGIKIQTLDNEQRDELNEIFDKIGQEDEGK